MPCQIKVYVAKKSLAINKSCVGQNRNEEL